MTSPTLWRSIESRLDTSLKGWRGRVDSFDQVEFLPIRTPAMRRAAAFWAEARREGRPTAPDPALDGDVILAAQAATLDRAGVIVATTNPRHLARYVAAELWTEIV